MEGGSDHWDTADLRVIVKEPLVWRVVPPRMPVTAVDPLAERKVVATVPWSVRFRVTPLNSVTGPRTAAIIPLTPPSFHDHSSSVGA